MLLGTINWNLERNDLEFNKELETRLLSEELSEFKNALKDYLKLRNNLIATSEENNDNNAVDDLVDELKSKVVDMIDAVCDSYFVLFGTKAKMLGNYFPEVSNFELQISYAKDVLKAILESDFNLSDRESDGLITESYAIVLEANKQKGKEKDEFGKVKKPESFVKPEEKIKSVFFGLLDKRGEELNKVGS